MDHSQLMEKGYTGRWRTGAGVMLANDGTGGGYGGAGGVSVRNLGGIAYGSAFQPVDRGSRGGLESAVRRFFCQGGGGGPHASNRHVDFNGQVTANGNASHVRGRRWRRRRKCFGDRRQINGSGLSQQWWARGKTAAVGGGGGGRIAISREPTILQRHLCGGGLGAKPWTKRERRRHKIPAPQLWSNPGRNRQFQRRSVDLTFGSMMNFQHGLCRYFTLETPNVLFLTSAFVVASHQTSSMLRLSFPPKMRLGYYEVQAGRS